MDAISPDNTPTEAVDDVLGGTIGLARSAAAGASLGAFGVGTFGVFALPGSLAVTPVDLLLC